MMGFYRLTETRHAIGSYLTLLETSPVERERVLLELRERIVRFAASHYTRDFAEDVAQEVLIILEEKYAHVAAIEELVPLALQIARYRLLAVRRKAARRGEYGQVSVDELPLPDLSASPLDELERRERLARLKAALAQVGERCREIIHYKLDGRSFPEIQQLMRVKSINTIYTWDYRCRKHLLELMGGSWETR
jgi:RNA polymerase sigma-70 factor (ECF subfamily)